MTHGEADYLRESKGNRGETVEEAGYNASRNWANSFTSSPGR